MPSPINRGQLALFGPSPAEREAHRVRVLQARYGIGPRDELLARGGHVPIIEQPPRPRRVRRHVEPPTPGHERRRQLLVVSKPPVPPNRMTAEEIDAWAGELVGEMAAAMKRGSGPTT